MYAEVIVDISHEKLDRPFTYKIPESLAATVEEGSLVEIPFGKGNKIISGYVIRIKENSDYDDSRIKDIAGLAKGGVKADSNLIRLASFIRKTYGSTQINALKTVMPVKKTVKREVKKRVIALLDAGRLEFLANEALIKHRNAQERLLRELIKYPDISYSFITGKMNVSSQLIAPLANNGILKNDEATVYRNNVKIYNPQKVT